MRFPVITAWRILGLLADGGDGLQIWRDRCEFIE